jgi:hypothetical protein
MAEVEERIGRIKNHKGVKGLLIVDENGKFLRSTMTRLDLALIWQPCSTPRITSNSNKAVGAFPSGCLAAG